jgi:hypothetical protein
MPDAMPMPFSCKCQCKWHVQLRLDQIHAHGPRLKAGGLVGLRDTVRYKRGVVEVCLEALTAFVLLVRPLGSCAAGTSAAES